jgi:teichoic acid transport system ATP-binding protein
MKVRFHETVHSPIFAYTIKDVKGFDICGTNTLYQNIDIGTVHKDETVLIVFRQKMLLNTGGYLLSLGCTGFANDEFQVYERRYDYMIFDVVSKPFSVGLFDMDSEIIINRI